MHTGRSVCSCWGPDGSCVLICCQMTLELYPAMAGMQSPGHSWDKQESGHSFHAGWRDKWTGSDSAVSLASCLASSKSCDWFTGGRYALFIWCKLKAGGEFSCVFLPKNFPCSWALILVSQKENWKIVKYFLSHWDKLVSESVWDNGPPS